MQLGKAPRRDGRSTRTREEGPIGMRLASRIFLAISVVILVLVVVAGWSLLAMNQIVALNRSLVTQTAPALRLEAALRESMPALVRLETRYAILHDAGYESLWKARAARVSQDFDRLRGLLLTRQETKLHLKAVAEFAMYQSLVGSLGSGVDRRTAAVSGLEPRLAATRSERALDRLQDATRASLEHSEQRARRLERRTWHAVMIALPASVVLALLGAGVIAVRMTRSLRRLSVATTQVVEGSFVAPVGVEGRDEIGRLAQAFNRMGERLREADRMKEEFFSHISHELRTPLTSVREAATLLRDEVPGVLAPKQARLVEIIAASTDRVLRLVNEILELSRLRAGLLAIDRRNVDIGNLVHRALEQVRPQAEARGLRMESNGAIDGARVLGDEERLLQVLVNLLGNAIKFTPPGGAVRLGVTAGTDRVEVAVEDTGVGIPPEALPRVFERYWQARGTRAGTGLGLAIVKSIVEMHGGRVQAHSSEGKGSRFVVQLPRAEAA
ncbi:MAG: HAMP domain-containing histidine kinase [Deltaproteobacteria bacterium]|nr:MAG: HAMP domain-containing histidine kinase [Deltaproteobacteria bacterium]